MGDFDPEIIGESEVYSTRKGDFDPAVIGEVDDSSSPNLRQRLKLKDSLLNKIGYVKNRTKEDKPDKDGWTLDDYRNLVQSTQFNKLDDETVANLTKDIDAKHADVSKKRGIFRIAADSVARGIPKAVYRNKASALAFKGDSQENRDEIQSYKDANTEVDIEHPRAVSGVKSIRGIGDAAKLAVDVIGENAGNAVGPLGAGITGAKLGSLAGPQGAVIGGIVGAGVGGLAGNLGEAVMDHYDDTGKAGTSVGVIAQGIGYSAIDAALGGEATAVRHLFKGVVGEPLKEAKKNFVGSIGKAMLEVAKGGAKGGLGEALQSQVVGRTRRLAETGSALEKGESGTDALWAAADEFYGGFFGDAGSSAIGVTGEYSRNKAMLKRADVVISKLSVDKDVAGINGLDKKLVADYMLGMAAMPEVDAGKQDIIRAKQAEIMDAADGKTKAVLNAYQSMFTDASFDNIPDTVKPTFNAQKAYESKIEEQDGSETYFDADSGVMIQGRDGDWSVFNRNGMKMPLTEENNVKTLKDAIGYAQNLSRLNQWRIENNQAKSAFIQSFAEKNHPGANVVMIDSPLQVKDEAVRSKFIGNEQGFYNPSDNTVYIMLDAVQNPAQAAIILNHEAFHSGFDAALKATGKSRDELLGKTRLGDNVTAEEYLAEAYAQREKDPATYSKAKLAVQKWIGEKTGIKSLVGDAEMKLLIQKVSAQMDNTQGGTVEYRAEGSQDANRTRYMDSFYGQGTLEEQAQRANDAAPDAVKPSEARVINRETKRSGLIAGMNQPTEPSVVVEKPSDVKSVQADMAPSEKALPASTVRTFVKTELRTDRIKENHADLFQQALDVTDNDEQAAAGLVSEWLAGQNIADKSVPDSVRVASKLEQKADLSPNDVDALEQNAIFGKDLFLFGYRKDKQTGSWKFQESAQETARQAQQSTTVEPVTSAHPVADKPVDAAPAPVSSDTVKPVKKKNPNEYGGGKFDDLDSDELRFLGDTSNINTDGLTFKWAQLGDQRAVLEVSKDGRYIGRAVERPWAELSKGARFQDSSGKDVGSFSDIVNEKNDDKGDAKNKDEPGASESSPVSNESVKDMQRRFLAIGNNLERARSAVTPRQRKSFDKEWKAFYVSEMKKADEAKNADSPTVSEQSAQEQTSPYTAVNERVQAEPEAKESNGKEPSGNIEPFEFTDDIRASIYLDQFNKMQAGKLATVLNKPNSLRSSFMRKTYEGPTSDVIRNMLVDGYRPVASTEPAIKDVSRVRFNRMNQREQDDFLARQKEAGEKNVYRLEHTDGSGFDIGKTEYDYAQWLVSKNNKATKQKITTHSESTSTPELSTTINENQIDSKPSSETGRDNAVQPVTSTMKVGGTDDRRSRADVGTQFKRGTKVATTRNADGVSYFGEVLQSNPDGTVKIRAFKEKTKGTIGAKGYGVDSKGNQVTKDVDVPAESVKSVDATADTSKLTDEERRKLKMAERIDAANADNELRKGNVEAPKDLVDSFNSSKERKEQRKTDNGVRFRRAVTPDQDAAYMEAVESGDMETAQRMVNDAAKAAGYTTVGYHGTNSGAFSEFNESPIFGKAWFFSDTPEYPTIRGVRVMTVMLAIRNTKNVKISTNQPWSVPSFEKGILDKAKDEGYDSVRLIAVPPTWMRIVLPLIGLRAEVTGYNNATVVFDPSQIKSADPATYDDAGNVIPLSKRFNSDSNDIRFRRSMSGTPSTADILDTETGLQAARRIVQDYMQPWESKQESLQKALKRKLSDDVDVYRAEDRSYGLIRNGVHQFEKNFIDKAEKVLNENGLTVDEFDQFLMAKAGPDRNKMIADRTDGKNMTGSGQSDVYWNNILAAYRKQGKYDKLNEAAEHVWALNRAVLDMKVEAGLMSKVQADVWKTKSPFYVPLRSDDAEADYKELGKRASFSLKRKESKSATGRAEGHEADTPFAFSVMQALEAVGRANKNKVYETAAKLIEQNPSDLWRIETRIPTKHAYDADSGKVISVPDAQFEDAPNVVIVKRGGKKQYLVFEGADGLKLARSLKKDSLQKAPVIVSALTRTYAMMRTAMVPTFILRNLRADFLQLTINMTAENKARMVPEVFKNMWHSWVAVNSYEKTGKASGALADYANEFFSNGGQIAGVGVQTVDKINQTLNRHVNKHGKFMTHLGMPALNFYEYIERGNATIETGTRMALYATLRKQGYSISDSIEAGKNITVNFNRKGELGPLVNSMYMFSNVAVQDAARSVKALSGKNGKAVVLGLLGAGFLAAMLNNGDDDEEDKTGAGSYKNIPESDKQRNIIIKVGGKYVKQPIRGIWAWIYYAGTKAGDVAFGKYDAKKAALNVGGAALDTINILGTSGSVTQFILPTIFDPLAQHSENRDWKGDPIYQRKFTDAQPDSATGMKRTPNWIKATAKGLNRVTGGDDATKGWIDVAPETIKYVIDTLAGGLGTDTSFAVGAISDAANGKGDVDKTPFLRDVVRDLPDTTSRYYIAKDKFDAGVYAVNHYKTAKERSSYYLENPFMKPSTADRIKALNKTIKDLRDKESKTDSDDRKKTLEARRLRLQATVISLVGKKSQS